LGRIHLPQFIARGGTTSEFIISDGGLDEVGEEEVADAVPDAQLDDKGNEA